jgi:hypothetical protein
VLHSMPSKSVSSYLRTHSNFFAFLVGFLGSGTALAAITVTSISGGSSVGASSYYLVDSTVLTANAFMDTGDAVVDGYSYPFSVVNTTIGQGSGAVADTNGANMLRFQIDLVDQTLAALTTGSYVLTVKAYNDSETALVPIAGVGGVDCPNANCFRPSPTPTPTATLPADSPLSYAVAFTDGMQFGIYPRDICQSANTQFSDSADGCLNSAVDTPVSGQTNNMKLLFEIIALDPSGFISGSPVASLTYNLKFQNSLNTFACPAVVNPSTPSQVYFPGDRQIFVNGAQFGLGLSNVAPASVLLVAAEPETTGVTLGSTFRTAGNDILQKVGLASDQTVTGFVNSTPTTNVFYQLGFQVRDAAGIVYTNSCTLGSVRTADIQSFLAKGQCFIATAAYGDRESVGVRHLRGFRDRILSRFALGRSFISFYYANSPAAAEWLIENDWLRPGVLLLLAPVQILAWTLLNPIWALGGLMMLTSLVLLGRMKILGGARMLL